MDNALFIIVAFLGFIVLFTLAVRYGAVFAGNLMGRRVYAMHRAMEYILDTEKIPQEWLEPAPQEPTQIAEWQQRQRQNALARLGKLQTYAENTPAFEDAESRLYVLDELARIREQWASFDFAELTF